MRIRLDIPLTVREIIKATGAAQYDAMLKAVVTHVTTDSREVCHGDLFFALSGEFFDGESFVSEAKSKGAICISKVIGNNTICVNDSSLALQNLAKYYKTRLKSLKYTVGITGSVGKTTTKEFLKIIASEEYKTHATDKNFNNHIGVPLTILSSPADTELLIIEMGMNHAGEIRTLSECSSPDLAIITNIGTAHIGNLGSREKIAEAKLEILCGMKNEKLILPFGEPLLSRQKNASFFSQKNPLSDIYIIYKEEKCEITYLDRQYKCDFEPRGEHNLECLCAAVCAAVHLGIDLEHVVSRISKISNKNTRQNIKSVGNFYILEDYYNASLESVSASFDFLDSMMGYTKKSALLGTVRELGEKSKEIHFLIGSEAAKHGLCTLYIFGEYAEDVRRGAIAFGMAENQIFVNEDINDPRTTVEEIATHIAPGEIILFKASHTTGLNRILDILEDVIK